MNSIKIFNNPQFGEIRVTTDKNDNPLFCLADICKALNLTNPSRVAQRLDNEDKTNLELGLAGSSPTFVTESGLYTVILRSDSLLAKPMQKWVTSEVLPAIRKHGGYLTPEKIEEALSNPDFIIKLATALKTERANNERLQFTNQQQSIELKEAAPKVEYYNKVLSSKSDFTTTTIAKELGMTAQSLNKILRRERIIYWLDDHYVLYANYSNKGYTSTRTGSYVDLNGDTRTAINTTWTERGRQFIHDLIKSIKTRQEKRTA